MKKSFCDICGKPATDRTIHHKDLVVSKLKDKSEIYLTVYIGFKNHPSGFGGPPDLCADCSLGFIDKFRKDILKSFNK